MPKSTFNNLSIEKQKEIETVLLELLSQNSPSQISVKQVIAQVDFSRAAFYKYFTDLTDAIGFVTKNAANFVHQTIMQEIMLSGDFILGTRAFLETAADYRVGSKERLYLQVLLNSGTQLLFKRKLTVKNKELAQRFKVLLSQTGIKNVSEEESINFLYLMMDLVVTELFSYVANGWNKQDLLADFDLRIKWLLPNVTD